MTFGNSLEGKLAYLTIGLLFVMVFGLGHIILLQQQSALVEQKQASFDSMARVVASTLEASPGGPGAARASRIVRDLHSTQPVLEFIIVTGEDGTTLLAESRKHATTARQRGLLGNSAQRVASYLMGKAQTGETPIYKTTTAIDTGGHSGLVTIGFSMSEVDVLMAEMRQSVLLWFALAFIVGIVGALALGRGLASQLRALLDGARKVMQGDMQVQVPVRSSDEVGELTQTFNKMIVHLGRQKERLEQQANTDSLTGLYNHRFFQERLAQEIKRAERYEKDLALVMIDLDHFKSFNDNHGHPAGDAALKAVAKILKQSVRDIDVAGRYGGEEFAVILPECPLDDAINIAERIRLGIQRHCFYGSDDETVPMTASLGVAHYPTHSQEREGLIFAADVALYQSKSLSRNRVTCFSGAATEGEDAPYQFYVALHATELSTIECLAEAIDAKHGLPSGFSRSVADLAVRISEDLGMPADDIKSVRVASLLRDIGQIGISDTILNKDGPLTEEERRTLESHPSLGHAIVERSTHFEAMLPGILHHHERWDGKGYPFGLVGHQIPLVARVIAVADTYCAMTTARPHRTPLSPQDAEEEIRGCSGTQFDARVVEVLQKVLAEDRDRKAA